MTNTWALSTIDDGIIIDTVGCLFFAFGLDALSFFLFLSAAISNFIYFESFIN